MNTLRRQLFNKFSTFSSRNNFIYNIVKRGKFRGPTQAGLSRYEYDNEDYQPLPFERSRLTHLSNAEELISRIPVVEVDEDVVLCYGVAEYGWGHPVEYIKLNTRYMEKPNICKYCGLRYVKKSHGHH